MKCPNCDKEIPDGSKFCNHCGSKIESQRLTCQNPKCGRTGLPSEALFCPDCGSKLLDSFISFTETVNKISFDMIAVEGGSFMMDDQYKVTLSRYYIGRTVVTQALWKIIMGKNPSSYIGDHLPVQHLSWRDCQIFITQLNQLTGKKYSLPTEAQWEFAARGGILSKGYKYAGSNNIDDVAWYFDNNLSDLIQPVAQKAPNELGLFDMSGNVWEWCQDYLGEYPHFPIIDPTGPEFDEESNTWHVRVLRGAGWFRSAEECAISYRGGEDFEYSASDMGLRIVLKY